MVATLRFDDIAEGLEVSFEQEVTDAHIDAFAALSGDVSPLHLDDAFARERGFPGRVAHGGLVSAFASRLFGVHLPGRDCLLHSLTMSYLHPVHAGDRLTLTARVTQRSEAARAVVADVTVARADGRVVARGKAQIGFTRAAPP
ncbi:MAG: MaoC family dehydratase [Alphaproteobacteria bacterium]